MGLRASLPQRHTLPGHSGWRACFSSVASPTAEMPCALRASRASLWSFWASTIAWSPKPPATASWISVRPVPRGREPT